MRMIRIAIIISIQRNTLKAPQGGKPPAFVMHCTPEISTRNSELDAIALMIIGGHS